MRFDKEGNIVYKDKKQDKTIKETTINKSENRKLTNQKNQKVDKNQKQKQAYLQSLKAGNTRKQASFDADAGVTTIWEWKQKDKQFSNDIESALESRIQVVEDALFNTATGKEGKAKVIAQIFWLKNRGKNWKDKQDVEFIAPTIVKQNTFIQAGEEPKITEEPAESAQEDPSEDTKSK